MNEYVKKGIKLIALILFSAEVAAQADNPNESVEQQDTIIESKDTPLPLEQIKVFAEVFSRIKHNYVKPVTDEKLLEYAIRGMLNGLDPHSSYLKDEKLDALNEGTSGQFGGLGIEVIMEESFVKVIAPIDDTPAAEAGIQSGDLIIRINGKTLSGNSLYDATKQMRGKPGTSITITVLRESDPEPFELTLKRAVIQTSSVKRRSLSDEIGYLRISQFQITTAESFRKQLKMLRDKEKFAGLIIDLRNNPGGLLTSAVSITDNFISEGIIVSTKGRRSDNNQEFVAAPTDLIKGKPIIVLINGGSASASEIVAGALQDHGRALILGTESFGKGSVQTVVNIGETEAIKLTTARYYTPSGRSIQAAGIVPDVLVPWRQFKEQPKTHKRIKENDLPGHLENKNTQKRSKKPKKIEELLARDYQLNEAFNLLKGMIFFNSLGQQEETKDL